MATTKESVKLEISNCIDCPHHSVRRDPDPDDWFNDDDVKVVCMKVPGEKDITVSCRPYNTRNECNIPTWCPLKSTS